MATYADIFRRATGFEPHGFQARIAERGLPDVLEAPTAAGKTAAMVLGWLWRSDVDPVGTPRRLIFALPQRSLVEQVASNCNRWLDSLGLTQEVALHVVMGGAGLSQHEWRIDMHRRAIVIGTVDSLVSKALNRAYGVGRSIFPIDFALVTNDAHWVIDEIQLCPESTTTMRQIAAFTKEFKTARPFGLTCMTATVPVEVLNTVDNPWTDTHQPLRIEGSDREGELKVRLEAQRKILELEVLANSPKTIADSVRQRHRPGALTLVVCNTVKSAREIHRALGGDTLLLHSRFRPHERTALAERLGAISKDPGAAGRIVVATQVVEAGIDIDAQVLITEAAPWPSIVQRAGRCNRQGRCPDAEMWWFAAAKPEPYERDDVAATVNQLRKLEGRAVTGEGLQNLRVPTKPVLVSVIRRRDLIDLFDTTPDLSGTDIDISPYVRDADELDVQLCWAQWPSGKPDGRLPETQWRCRAPIGEVRKLLQHVTAWRWNHQNGTWEKATKALRPGEVLLLRDTDGGYEINTGFDASLRSIVDDCPRLVMTVDRAAGGEDGFGEDDPGIEPLTLDQHSYDARRHAEALVRETGAELADDLAETVVRAAWVHDLGKCHPLWQKAALRHLRETEGDIWSERVVAKSGRGGMLRFEGDVRFRHELLSFLIVDGPYRDLIRDLADPDLACYLVLAHHGKLRVQVREPADSTVDWNPKILLGLKAGESISVPSLLGKAPTDLTVDIEQFSLGDERSWTRTALGLRDRYGPFILAYLETLVRIADWRASKEREANPTEGKDAA